MREIILAPSLLSADFANTGTQLSLIEDSGVRYLHLDVMDGTFVPSISFGMPVIKSLRKSTSMIFDVHLMIEDPDRYVDEFRACGADIITVHYEAVKHLDRTLHHIKDTGAEAAVALNPATPVSLISHVLPLCDMVLLMSVNPGFGGQKYIPYVTGKIRELADLRDRLGLDFDIEVDGGISPRNAGEVIGAGANVLVAGSAVFNGDIKANISAFTEVCSR